MIDALIHGRLIHCREEGNLLVGRIVLADDKPIQFSARRGAVKSALRELPTGMPVSVAGRLTTGIRFDKDTSPYVHHEITISAVLTAQPKSLMGSIF